MLFGPSRELGLKKNTARFSNGYYWYVVTYKYSKLKRPTDQELCILSYIYFYFKLLFLPIHVFDLLIFFSNAHNFSSITDYIIKLRISLMSHTN